MSSLFNNNQLRQAWRRERREAAKRNSRAASGLGFLAWDEPYDLYESNYGFDGYGYNYGDLYYDPWADSYYGFGSGDLPIAPPINFDLSLPSYRDVTGQNFNPYYDDWGTFWESFFSGGDLFVDSPGVSTSTDFLPTNPGSTNDDPWLPDNFFDWLTGIFDDGSIPGTTPTTGDPALPGYCPRGTYHPVNDPFACVPFPPNDPNASRQAKQQQQAAQKAAQAARAAQQQQDKQCPKDPQGRPVWRNPQTGKCELVPQCPQGSKFDSTTKRCLTPAQLKAAYGDNSWLWWLLGGGAALLLLSQSSGGRRR